MNRLKVSVTLLLCLLIVGLAGCGLFDERHLLRSREIKSVTLECKELCTGRNDQPFQQKTYTDRDSINQFVQAIRSSKRIEGELDYGVTLLMSLQFKSGKIEEYVLNISNDEMLTHGLLVKRSNSSTAYDIPVKATKKLKQIIYN